MLITLDFQFFLVEVLKDSRDRVPVANLTTAVSTAASTMNVGGIDMI